MKRLRNILWGIGYKKKNMRPNTHKLTLYFLGLLQKM